MLAIQERDGAELKPVGVVEVDQHLAEAFTLVAVCLERSRA